MSMSSTVRWMTTFAAVTYNVLAQSYAYPDRYPASPPQALDAPSRRTLLLERIAGLDADLLCLQELEPAVHSDLRTSLDTTHHGGYVQRSGRPDGVAVFARRSLFGWRGQHELHYRATRPGYDDVAVVVELELDGRPLYVASTHLTWQPDPTPPAEHIGHRQMLELLDHRDATAPDGTWILAGDFNAGPGSVVLDSARQRGMDDGCRSQRPADTAAVNGRPRRLDYLLYSAGRLDPRPGALPDLSRDTVLPSLTEPSDHLPLRVHFSTVA
jgi:mRNA deadenylase 3'-5' endonuclease subunit Ccr4